MGHTIIRIKETNTRLSYNLQSVLASIRQLINIAGSNSIVVNDDCRSPHFTTVLGAIHSHVRKCVRRLVLRQSGGKSHAYGNNADRHTLRV